jgi:hypothetical protein
MPTVGSITNKSHTLTLMSSRAVVGHCCSKQTPLIKLTCNMYPWRIATEAQLSDFSLDINQPGKHAGCGLAGNFMITFVLLHTLWQTITGL